MRFTVFSISALVAIAAGASPEMLAPPRFLDPTRMRSFNRSGALDLQTTFFGDDKSDGFTLVAWVKWTPRPDLPAAVISVYNPFVQVLVSADPARATKEGGAELENLCSHRYDVPLRLANGTWAEACLPATYDTPWDPPWENWRYGCYCVNVETDTALTVNVGGAERSVAASNGVMQVFNIQATSASRAVSVAAASAGATVRFGIAEMPLVQFFGAQFDSCVLGPGTLGDAASGGISASEWRMVVGRGSITNGAVTVHACGYNATSRMQIENMIVQDMWRPRATFAKDARIRLCVCSMVGLENDDVFTLYGFRVYRGWMSDAEIERMRDQDVAEMTRRGI